MSSIVSIVDYSGVFVFVYVLCVSCYIVFGKIVSCRVKSLVEQILNVESVITFFARKFSTFDFISDMIIKFAEQYKIYYNTPMLHFGLYVTFQPCVHKILAHCTSCLAHCTSLFGPVAMPTNEHPTPPPTPTPWHRPTVFFGWKSIKENIR